MNLETLKKNRKLFLVLGLVLVVGIAAFLVIDVRKEVPEPVVIPPEVEFHDYGGFYKVVLPHEKKIVSTVLELKRSPVAHFFISIEGVVRGFFDRTLIVEKEGEQLKVPIMEGGVIVTEVWDIPEIPEEIAALTPGQITLLQILPHLEMVKVQGILPNAPLAEVINRIREEVGEIPVAPPALFAPPVPGQPRLEPFPLEDIKIGDIVRIQARIGTWGDLEAFEVVVTRPAGN